MAPNIVHPLTDCGPDTLILPPRQPFFNWDQIQRSLEGEGEGEGVEFWRQLQTKLEDKLKFLGIEPVFDWKKIRQHLEDKLEEKLKEENNASTREIKRENYYQQLCDQGELEQERRVNVAWKEFRKLIVEHLPKSNFNARFPILAALNRLERVGSARCFHDNHCPPTHWIVEPNEEKETEEKS